MRPSRGVLAWLLWWLLTACVASQTGGSTVGGLLPPRPALNASPSTGY
jgi:hypothetical protein